MEQERTSRELSDKMLDIKVGKIGEPLILSWDKIGKGYDYSI